MSFGTVELDKHRRFVVRTPYSPVTVSILARSPERMWDAVHKVWRLPPSRRNIEHLRSELPSLMWLPEAQALADNVLSRGAPPPRAEAIEYAWRHPEPYRHQLEAAARSFDAPAYALLMEQRTGKTRVFIDNAAYLYARSKIDFVLVIAPNSVKTVWEEQIPEWCPEWCPTTVHVYRSAKKKAADTWLETVRTRGFKVSKAVLPFLIVNVEMLSSATGLAWLQAALAGFQVFAVVDEASRFKDPRSNRTKALLKLRTQTLYRRIGTGTLVTQGPLDVFAPFAFLDPAILGYTSFYSFRNDFAILGGYGNKQVIGYVNTEKLADLIAPFSYRVTRAECFDLPPKVYAKIEVELTATQRQLYDQMRDTMLAEHAALGVERVHVYDDERGNPVYEEMPRQIGVTIVLTQLLRLQQIVGGFLPRPTTEGEDPEALPIPGGNPKLDAMLEAIEEMRGKILIWARFRPEIALIAETLRAAYGAAAVVEFHGGVSETQRTLNRRAFQEHAHVRFFVGQPAAGGLGIPLHAANDVIFFSNDYSLETRLQAEDRAQAGSKKTATGYLDIMAKDTGDKGILAVLRGKKSLADIVNKDALKEWI